MIEVFNENFLLWETIDIKLKVPIEAHLLYNMENEVYIIGGKDKKGDSAII